MQIFPVFGLFPSYSVMQIAEPSLMLRTYFIFLGGDTLTIFNGVFHFLDFSDNLLQKFGQNRHPALDFLVE